MSDDDSSYLPLILSDWVVDLPAIFWKRLPVLKGKERLREERERVSLNTLKHLQLVHTSGCFHKVVPGYGREGMCTLTVFQTPPNCSVPPSCMQTGGFSSPVEKQELILKGVCKRINRSKDRKRKRLRANEEWKKTDVPFALQTISSPWVLSPCLWTAIDSSLLMAPRFTSSTNGGSFPKHKNNVINQIKHLCSLRSEKTLLYQSTEPETVFYSIL